MPKDPTTKASAAASPPKKPPVVDTAEIFPPKPPPDLPPNVQISSPAQAIANLRIPDVSDEDLIAAFKDKPLYVLDRVNWPKLKSPYRKRLENLINQDPALKKILDYVLPVYPSATPQTQPQPAAAPAQEIPTVTAEKIAQPEPKAAPKNEVNAENAPAIEALLNDFKPGFYRYLEEQSRLEKQNLSTTRGIAYSRAFTQHFWSYLSLYRSRLLGFYLHEGAYELLFSALGPFGHMMASYHSKKMSWEIAWQKNLLNPNSIYYYLNSLPSQKAFELIKYPLKASWAILANGGAPFISKVHYLEDKFDPHQGWVKENKSKFVFAPLHQATQFSHGLADKLDKASGIPTDFFSPSRFQDSPYDAFIKQKNKTLSQALNNLKAAKESGNKQKIKLARQITGGLVKRYDGPFGKRLLRSLRYNAARRLRQTHRDPISFLLALVGGFIWDATVGLVLSTLRVAATKALNAIPGVNVLRARITEFFTSNRWLQTARMGGATLQSFGKALVSPTSFSSGYLGAGAGGWVANALGLPVLPGQIIGGGIGYGLGAFYKTSLNMTMNPTSLNWIYRYNELLFKATDINLSVAEQNYWRGQLEKEFLRVDARIANFRPGPFSNFAKWLYENPYARIPVNGWVIGDIAAKIFGWNPWVSRISFATADWIWQTRGAWSSAIARWFPTTPLGRWIGNQALSVQTWFTEKIFMRPIAWETSSLLGKMPVKWALRPFWQGLQNFWSKIQPYASNVFNPGFFMGMQFLGSVFMSMGLPWGVAHLVGGLAGAAGWWGIHAIYSAIAGKGAMSLAKWSAAGWVGYFGGLFVQGLLSLIGVHGAWMQFLPLAGSLIATVGVALIPGLGSFFGSFFAGLSAYNIAWALGISSTAYATGMAIAATVASIALVAGLTIFAGFVIYSAFWVPFQAELAAGPQSSNFSINTNCSQTASNHYNCCSNFSLTNNVFNSQKYLDHNTDFIRTNLTVDLSDPAATTDAFRGQQLEYKTYVTEWADGNNYSLVIPPGNMIDDAHPYLDAFLPTPTDEPQTLKELMTTNQSVVYSMKPLFDILKNLAEEYGQAQHLIAEYEASLTLMKEQEKLVDDLIGEIKDGDLDGTLTKANEYLPPPASRNPLSDPCPDAGQPCPEEKQGIKKLYDSWEPTVKRYVDTITNYQNQATPDLDGFLAQLEQEFEGLKQQIDLLPDIIDQMKEIQKKIDSQEKADAILNANFLGFTNMSPAEQDAAWDLLAKYFSDIFDKDKTFYFIPQGTNYRVCIDTTYTGPVPAEPQTVCSTISYDPSLWSPNTAFAKHCVTFTPEANP